MGYDFLSREELNNQKDFLLNNFMILSVIILYAKLMYLISFENSICSYEIFSVTVCIDNVGKDGR